MSRSVIPICKAHGMFQTGNGRWLQISTDLEKHIEFTKSYDAILSEGECIKCTLGETRYCSTHERHQTNEGYWVDTILYSHISRPIESPCDNCKDINQIEINYEEIT